MFGLKFLKKTKFDNYDDYIENGAPIVPEHFNFSYDVIDVLANETPDNIALLWETIRAKKRNLHFVTYHVCQMQLQTFCYHAA